MPYLQRSFYAKEPYNSRLFCGKRPAILGHPMHLCHPVVSSSTRTPRALLHKSPTQIGLFWGKGPATFNSSYASRNLAVSNSTRTPRASWHNSSTQTKALLCVEVFTNTNILRAKYLCTPRALLHRSPTQIGLFCGKKLETFEASYASRPYCERNTCTHLELFGT